MGRIDNLRNSHFPYCQPLLSEDESGFLMQYSLPETNLDEFRMNLSIIGLSEKRPTNQDRVPEPMTPKK